MKAEITDHLFAHCTWANKKLLMHLSELPQEVLGFSGWNPDWTVGKLASHIVFAQERMWARASGVEVAQDQDVAITAEGMRNLADISEQTALKIYELLDGPNLQMKFLRLGKEVEYSRATILSQIVHHSTEHRTQISDILAMNKMDVVNLDSLDQWTFAVQE